MYLNRKCYIYYYFGNWTYLELLLILNAMDCNKLCIVQLKIINLNL